MQDDFFFLSFAPLLIPFGRFDPLFNRSFIARAARGVRASRGKESCASLSSTFLLAACLFTTLNFFWEVVNGLILLFH